MYRFYVAPLTTHSYVPGGHHGPCMLRRARIAFEKEYVSNAEHGSYDFRLRFTRQTYVYNIRVNVMCIYIYI